MLLLKSILIALLSLTVLPVAGQPFSVGVSGGVFGVQSLFRSESQSNAPYEFLSATSYLLRVEAGYERGRNRLKFATAWQTVGYRIIPDPFATTGSAGYISVEAGYVRWLTDQPGGRLGVGLAAGALLYEDPIGYGISRIGSVQSGLDTTVTYRVDYSDHELRTPRLQPFLTPSLHLEVAMHPRWALFSTVALQVGLTKLRYRWAFLQQSTTDTEKHAANIRRYFEGRNLKEEYFLYGPAFYDIRPTATLGVRWRFGR